MSPIFIKRQVRPRACGLTTQNEETGKENGTEECCWSLLFWNGEDKASGSVRRTLTTFWGWIQEGWYGIRETERPASFLARRKLEDGKWRKGRNLKWVSCCCEIEGFREVPRAWDSALHSVGEERWAGAPCRPRYGVTVPMQHLAFQHQNVEMDWRRIMMCWILLL